MVGEEVDGITYLKLCLESCSHSNIISKSIDIKKIMGGPLSTWPWENFGIFKV
ncbi:hypothetical protein RYX36_005273 [Vicia faba]